ncbi:indigoidine synthase A-like protein, partial [Cristinia sonorae]
SIQNAVARGAPIDIHPEVQEALAHKRPLVALETTIVTHGMPHPTNLHTARSIERIVRENGAIPATIGIIQGRVKIGLEPHELERLADVANNPSVVKVSRRDIGPVISLKGDGGTTCSSTLIFAALAGIKVFATGGLGGVHRGGERSMDVSADLQELTRCSVGLVSAGVKSILDIGRTLEYLETLGVPVVSYGETSDFPAFYTRRSGFQSPWHTNDSSTAASILLTQHQLGMNNGVMFAVPIPEKYELVGQEIQNAVELAVKEAEENGINRRGKEVTPWLLKRVSELTAGKSLPSNIALIENTALNQGNGFIVYSHIESLVQLLFSLESASATLVKDSPQASQTVAFDSPRLVVIGSSAVDISAQVVKDTDFVTHSTVPGAVTMSLGGVGRNMAEAAHRKLTATSTTFINDTVLVSAIGRDSFGRLLSDETKQIGMRTDGFINTISGRTAVCNLILDTCGGLTGGIADMDIIHSLDGDVVLGALNKYTPELVAVDGNLSEKALASVVQFCNKRHIPVFFEPTSVTKSARILPAIASSTATHPPISFASPNLLELAHMYKLAGESPLELTQRSTWWDAIDSMGLGSEFRMDLEQLSKRAASDNDPSKGRLSFLLDKGIAQMAIHLLPFLQHIIIKCGDVGVIVVFRTAATSQSSWIHERSNVHARQVVARGQDGSCLVFKHFPAIHLTTEDIVNVTGAGDSLVGSILSSLVQIPHAFQDPSTLSQLVLQAQEAAVKTLQSPLAVSPLLSQVV